jgi:hypothetical protein
MEVYEVLKNRRLAGSDKYYSVASICRLIIDCKINGSAVGSNDNRAISRDVHNLYRMGIFEKKKISGIECFRIRLNILSDD